MSTLPSESRILSEVRLAAGEYGLTLWRNNVAQAWTGEAHKITRTGLAKVGPGDVVIRNARPLHAGLCKGSSDLIGLKPMVITEADIGRTVAQFAALEVKSKTGRVSPAQRTFLDFVERAGGLAQVVRSASDLGGAA